MFRVIDFKANYVGRNSIRGFDMPYFGGLISSSSLLQLSYPHKLFITLKVVKSYTKIIISALLTRFTLNPWHIVASRHTQKC